jgi:hypothetical protein
LTPIPQTRALSGGTVVGFLKRAYRHATAHEEQKPA